MSRRAGQTIAVLGHLGEKNFGDELMLQAFLRGARERLPGVAFVVVTHDPDYTSTMFGGTEVEVRPRTLGGVLSAIRAADRVVLCGGTHMHDFEKRGTRRLGASARIARWVGVFAFARAIGRPVAMVGVGVGPLTSRSSRWLTRLAIRLCDVICVRDEASQRLAVELVGDVGGIHLTADLAFGEEPTDTRPEARAVLGISLVPFFRVYHGAPGRDRRVAHTVAEAVRRVSQAQPLDEVKLFALYPSQDLPLVRSLVDELVDAPQVAEVRVHTFDGDPSESREAIAECTTMVASRYHSMIAGALEQVPLVALSYHPKCSEFARELGLPDHRSLSLRSFDADALAHAIVTAPGEPTPSFDLGAARRAANRNLDLLLDPP